MKILSRSTMKRSAVGARSITPTGNFVRRVAASGLGAVVLLPTLTNAQQSLEEIIVTAERREQSLQDVSISATVVTGDDLVTKGIDNLQEMQQIAPSLAINTFNRSTFINIRGVGIAQAAPTSSPGVAYYLDGTLIPHEVFIGHSFYDIGSVEVLRGPQGTLTGQNSTGGAIYVRTPEPETEKMFGYLDQSIANYDSYRTTGALNLPLSDKAAVRVAAVYDTRDSFTDNIGPSGSSPGSGDLFGVRTNLAYSPTESIKINLRGDYFNLNSDDSAVKNRNDLVTSDPFTIEEDAKTFLNEDGYRISGEARIDLSSNVQFRVLTSWQDGDQEQQQDGDRTATARARPTLEGGRVHLTTVGYETFTSEVNLLSTGEGAFQWVIGAFYLDESIPALLLTDRNNTTDFVSATDRIDIETENTSVSGFGQINYRFTEAWEVIAGLRYTEDNQDLTRTLVPGPPPPQGFPFTTSADSSEVTGRGGLNFHLNEDTMLYGSFSRGYKAGGINALFFQPNYEPERNEVVELGFKKMLFDGRLRVNGAGFYSDYTNVQLLSVTAIPPFPPISLTQNAATAEAYGAELEIAYAHDRIAFNLGTGYLQAEFAEDVILNNGNTNMNQLVPKGSSLPFSPEWTLNAGIQYDFPIGGLMLTPRLQYSYTAEQLADPFPSRATRVDSRGILDFKTTLKVSDVLSLEAFVTNFTDETYLASNLQPQGANGGFIYGAPLQFGVRGRYSF